ncbi:hypothetical protein SAMN03159417_00369 [Ralstonia sp. NFACC01]|nr:hypothetical protein SAMN03159417_00369 [Ralstonia sp. NFACC01]
MGKAHFRVNAHWHGFGGETSGRIAGTDAASCVDSRCAPRMDNLMDRLLDNPAG